MVCDIAVGGVIENRNRGLHFAQLLAQLDPRSIRQPHVEDEKIETDLPREIQSLRHAARRQHAIAAVVEQRSHHQARILMIVDVENACLGDAHGSFAVRECISVT